MYLFTTTTLINANAYLGNTADPIFEADGTNKVLKVRRLNNFKKDNIKCVVKTVGENGVVDVATIPLDSYLSSDKIAADTRIGLYIRSVGNADPMYANNLVFKGKPLYIELPANTAKTDIPAVANKYLNLVFGGVALVIATMDKTTDTTLVLTCVNAYLRITKVTIATRSTTATAGGEYLFGDGTEVEDAVTKGHEGHGTYEQIMKDLRLPTGANLRWKRTMEDEMPEPGALYDEYVLTYCVDRGIMGLSAVGSEVTSKTTHVFLVKHGTASDAFTAALTTIGLTAKDPKMGTTGGDRESETIYTPYEAFAE